MFLLRLQTSAVPACWHHRGLSFPALVPPPVVENWCLLLGARLLTGEQEGLLRSPGSASVLGNDCALNLRGTASLYPARPPPPSPQGHIQCDCWGKRHVSVPAAAGADPCFVSVQDLGAERFSCPSSRADGFCLYSSSRSNGVSPGSFGGGLQGRQEGGFYTPPIQSQRGALSTSLAGALRVRCSYCISPSSLRLCIGWQKGRQWFLPVLQWHLIISYTPGPLRGALSVLLRPLSLWTPVRGPRRRGGE